MQQESLPMEGIHSSETDADLINACLSGHEHAWRQLIQRYKNLVYSIPNRLAIDKRLADKIFVAVWQDCWDHLQQLRKRKSMLPWLIKRTLRQCQRNASVDSERIEELKSELVRDQLILGTVQKLAPEKQETIHRLFSGSGRQRPSVPGKH